MKEMLIESLLVVVFIGVFLFPIAYSFYYKLQYKIVFIAVCYGMEQIIIALLVGLVSPLIILSIFAFSQLEANGSLESVRWLVVLTRFYEEYWYWFSPIILLILPALIQRGYPDVFIKQ
ncbi:MAG: hypothetical protein ABW157_21135 [Candidatus Thiodiazotropha sp. LLP2]